MNGGHTSSNSSKSGSSTPTFVSYHHSKQNPNSIYSSMPTIFAAPKPVPTKPLAKPYSRNDYNNSNINYNNSSNNKPDPFTPFDPWDNIMQGIILFFIFGLLWGFCCI